MKLDEGCLCHRVLFLIKSIRKNTQDSVSESFIISHVIGIKPKRRCFRLRGGITAYKFKFDYL